MKINYKNINDQITNKGNNSIHSVVLTRDELQTHWFFLESLLLTYYIEEGDKHFIDFNSIDDIFNSLGDIEKYIKQTDTHTFEVTYPNFITFSLLDLPSPSESAD